MRFRDVQRHAVDPAAHQGVLAGKEQRRRDAERAGNGERAAFAPEQRVRQSPAPPWHAVKPPQHRLDLAALGAKAAALDGGKHIAFEHDAGMPAAVQFVGNVVHARF